MGGKIMIDIIYDILHEDCTNEEKRKKLNIIAEDLEMARRYLSGEFAYCAECDDYYLSKSFILQEETQETNICIYEDPINSGGNEYAPGYLDITYIVCPKGHKKKIDSKERRKRL